MHLYGKDYLIVAFRYNRQTIKHVGHLQLTVTDNTTLNTLKDDSLQDCVV